MGAEVIRTEPDWVEISNEWKLSGKNQYEFCKDKSFSYSQFKNARAKLGLTRRARRRRKSRTSTSRPEGKSAKVSFLPLALDAESRNVEPPGIEKPKVEVELPFGVVVRFYQTGAQ